VDAKDYLLSAVASGLYVLLIGVLVSYTATWGDPAWWYDVWGKGKVSAVSWMQFVHSVGVVLAALPIASILVWRYRSAWFRPTSIAATLAGFFVLINQIRGIRLLIEQDVRPSTYHLLSGGIDIVKVGLILLLAAALLNWLSSVRENRA